MLSVTVTAQVSSCSWMEAGRLSQAASCLPGIAD